MTGPSLANIWERKAGIAEGFGRYSDALKSADVVWNEKTLDRWLKNPKDFIPGNEMGFRGVKDSRARQDLIAFLKAVSSGKAPRSGGMMGGQKDNLKNPDPRSEIKAIRYCGDTYFVTTVAGRNYKFWEFNLRFKSDSSDSGPPPGRPALLGSGMQGDRAFAVFTSPGEISRFIQQECR